MNRIDNTAIVLHNFTSALNDSTGCEGWVFWFVVEFMVVK